MSLATIRNALNTATVVHTHLHPITIVETLQDDIAATIDVRKACPANTSTACFAKGAARRAMTAMMGTWTTMKTRFAIVTAMKVRTTTLPNRKAEAKALGLGNTGCASNGSDGKTEAKKSRLECKTCHEYYP